METKVPETVEDGWPDQERLPRAASLCAILVHVEAPVMSQTGRAGYPQVGEAIRSEGTGPGHLWRKKLPPTQGPDQIGVKISFKGRF